MISKGMIVGSLVFGFLMMWCAYRLLLTHDVIIFIPLVVSTGLFGVFTICIRTNQTNELEKPRNIKKTNVDFDTLLHERQKLESVR